ncbi:MULTISPECIES: transcriptional regulator GcvA [Inquilinus]|uniref:DNA-binding transcriptional LysR family regulator n=1 Tax=Inquilinus ginsengisoli TaxID=363840 RepID=A0ABU1JQ98_9PROT|nr:transcriptional regulator GcvA [Inquilinus ginsengisoli]MDR6290801.1 DNA-binding transcriptional LysR family regulator [Inquilinus ginsengisoli]
MDVPTRRRLLPSLNAIRTFEAVARHQSFTHAAAELYVTQSAASRLVRSLETYLDLPLFVRVSRRIELTDQGRFYADLVRDALDRIEAGTMELISTRDGGGTLSIGMLPTFGTRWLIPRLSAFQALYPDIVLNLVSNDGPLDFAAQKIDVAVRFGHGGWPDAIAEPLMSEEVVVVCSPAIMAGRHPLSDFDALEHHRLIRHATRPDAWNHWFRSIDVTPAALHWGPTLEHFYMVIQAAIAGLGIALLPRLLVEDEIQRRALIVPYDVRVTGPGAYYVVSPKAKAELMRVRAFRRWIIETSKAA